MADAQGSGSSTPVGSTGASPLGADRWPSADAALALAVPVAQVAESRRVAFVPMGAADLDAVHAVEQSAYARPWSRKQLADSVAAGHPAVMLVGEALPGELPHAVRPDGSVLLGYLVAMAGVDEVHLLNITVAPAYQRQGWARLLLDALVLWSRGQQAEWLWLEVRASNTRAQEVYQRFGFRQVGLRKGYYPDGQFQREDAVVMRCAITGPATDEGGA